LLSTYISFQQSAKDKDSQIAQLKVVLHFNLIRFYLIYYCFHFLNNFSQSNMFAFNAIISPNFIYQRFQEVPTKPRQVEAVRHFIQLMMQWIDQK